MASTREYLLFVLDQLRELEGLRHRAMMGEFLLYYDDKVVGGIYDDRLLLKATPGARQLMEAAPIGAQLELPYPGGSEMLLADADDPELCCRVIRAAARELPPPKRRR